MSYDTPLSLSQALGFRKWKAALPADLQNSSDYDLQGAYLASAKANGRAHMTDQFKKPNHMTFSDGSQYSNAQTPGGHWSDTGNDSYVYWASPENLAQHSGVDMSRYFKENEAKSSIVLPIDYRLK